MGWNSKSGILKNEKISEDELWSYFNYFFSDSCSKTTTYKFAFLKSILDNLFNNIPFENGYKISYYNIFEKFAESFWNLVVKYNLRQQALNSQGKTSKIEQIFNELINKNPILQNLEFSSMEEDTKIRTIKKVLTECKKYVIGAFYGDFNGFLYGFEENTDYLVFSNTAYNFLVKYKMEIEKLNYYSWAKFLEKINEENVLYKILTKLDLSIPKRSPLDIYREMARAYNAGMVQYGPENYKTNENGERGEGVVTYTCTQNKDGKFDCVRTEFFDDETGLFSVTATQMIVTDAEQSAEQMAALDWSGAQSSAVYSVKTEKVLSSTDEKIVAAVAAAREEDGQQSDENLAANAIRTIGRQAAADRYHENNARFLWVKNIWYPDTSYKHPVTKESEISENYYTELTHYLSAEKSQANGYYILIVISIGTMFLSQFIISKSQKAQNELQTADGRGQKTQKVMLIVMPIIFGIFSFFYSAAFSIYMIVSNLFSILSTLSINFFIDRKFAKIEEQEIREKYNKRIPQSARNPQKGTNGGKTK